MLLIENQSLHEALAECAYLSLFCWRRKSQNYTVAYSCQQCYPTQDPKATLTYIFSLDASGHVCFS